MLFIGDRRLNLEKRELFDHLGNPIDLRRQSLDVLIYLARNAGSIVSRERIINKVWHDVAVTDDSLVQCISDIRRALGDAGKKNLRTLPRQGYRLTVDGALPAVFGDDDPGTPPIPDARPEPPSAPVFPERPSIAVLPFVNMSGDPAQDVFSEGICENIITALSRIRWFFVIARTSSFSYKAPSVDVREAARELGVRYVLTGSVRASKHVLRVTAKLVEANSGAHVWADNYDRELVEIFDVQDEITRNVVASLHTQIQLAEGSASGRGGKPENEESVPMWVQLNRAWSQVYKMKPDSLDEAAEVAGRCLVHAPNSSRASQILAAALFHRAWMGFSSMPSYDFRDSLLAAENAVLFDPQNEYAHWILGLCCMAEGDHDRAISALERAIAINPNCSLAFGSLATVQNYTGEPERALENNRLAIRSNPRDPSIFFRYTGLSLSHYLCSRFDKAVQWSRKAISAKPDFEQAHLILIASLVEAGRMDEAHRALRESRAKCPMITLEKARALPFRRADQLAGVVAALERAGLRD